MRLTELTGTQELLAQSQGGLLTDAQARGLLGGAEAVRALIDVGVLERVDAHVVALPGAPAPDRAMRAAALAVPRAVLSGPSAALVHGLDLPEPPARVTLTVPRNASRPRIPGGRVVRADVHPRDRCEVNGLPVLTPAATLADLARRHGLREAVVAADCALRSHVVDDGALRRACSGARGSGAARVRRLPGLVDPKAMSALESMCRLAMHEAGLPAPVTQLAVRDADGTIVGHADFGWERERVLLESDGFAWHSERQDYRKDRERLNAFTRLGWRLLRVTWEDVVLHPDRLVQLVGAVLLLRRPRVRTAS